MAEDRFHGLIGRAGSLAPLSRHRTTARHLRHWRLPHILDLDRYSIQMWQQHSVHGQPHCRDCEDEQDYGQGFL